MCPTSFQNLTNYVTHFQYFNINYCHTEREEATAISPSCALLGSKQTPYPAGSPNPVQAERDPSMWYAEGLSRDSAATAVSATVGRKDSGSAAKHSSPWLEADGALARLRGPSAARHRIAHVYELVGAAEIYAARYPLRGLDSRIDQVRQGHLPNGLGRWASSCPACAMRSELEFELSSRVVLAPSYRNGATAGEVDQ